MNDQNHNDAGVTALAIRRDSALAALTGSRRSPLDCAVSDEVTSPFNAVQ